MPNQQPNNNALPTRKWVAARVTALTGLAIMWATTGSWDLEETIAAITLVSESTLSYLTPNRPPVEEVKDYAGT